MEEMEEFYYKSIEELTDILVSFGNLGVRNWDENSEEICDDELLVDFLSCCLSIYSSLVEVENGEGDKLHLDYLPSVLSIDSEESLLKLKKQIEKIQNGMRMVMIARCIDFQNPLQALKKSKKYVDLKNSLVFGQFKKEFYDYVLEIDYMEKAGLSEAKRNGIEGYGFIVQLKGWIDILEGYRSLLCLPEVKELYVCEEDEYYLARTH